MVDHLTAGGGKAMLGRADLAESVQRVPWYLWERHDVHVNPHGEVPLGYRMEFIFALGLVESVQ